MPALRMPGIRNVYVGEAALNGLGTDSVGIGNRALDKATGAANIALGSGVMAEGVVTGSANVGVGISALAFLTAGSDNVGIGNSALGNNTIGNSNVAIGRDALISNDTGDRNTACGQGALSSNTTGTLNVGIGFGALRLNITGTENTALGHDADVIDPGLSNATAIGAGTIVDASDKIRLGNTSVTVLEAQVALTVVSDKTKKENFQPLDGEEVLHKLRDVPLSSWNFIGHNPAQFRHYGPMAQDFFAAFGDDGVGTIGTPTTLNSGDMAGILMSAVQALEQRTTALQEREAQLEARVAQLEALIRTLLPAGQLPADGSGR